MALLLTKTDCFRFSIILPLLSLIVNGGRAEITRSIFVGSVELRKCPTADFDEKFLEIPQQLLLKGDDNLTETFTFGLKSQDLECNDALDIETLRILVLNGSSTIFSEKGYLKVNKTYYSPNEYCIQSNTKADIAVKLCTSKCSLLNPCIQKCCEMDEVWDMTQYEKDGKIICRPSGVNKWTPVLYDNQHSKVSENELKNTRPRFISNHPKNWCDGQFSILTLRQVGLQDVTPFKILQDGSVLEKFTRTKWSLISKDKFCVDGVQNIPLELGPSGPYSGMETDTIVLDCRGFQEEIPSESIESGNLYVFAMCIAIIFLSLTILSHLILWKKQNIHGWTLLGYVISLLLQFSFVIFARLIEQRGIICTIVAIGTHFAALSTFAWLTTMNFDVWLTFRTMNPSPGRSHEMKRFGFYALFAMAVPVTIVSVALILDHIYGEDPYSEVIIPGYGQEKCGIDRSAELPYLYGPISVLLTTNLLFIFTTLYYVYRNQKILKSNGLKTKILNHKIRFFGMLFLVAGVTWIFDVISWAATSSSQMEVTPWYWILFDFVNILQAIAIFVIFVCNPHTVAELKQEIPCLSKICESWSSKSKQGPETSRKMSRTQISNVNGGFDDLLELK